MVSTCPHCGSKTDKPMVYSRAAQMVLNYIWNHPDCTRKEIERAVYGKYRPFSNIVPSQIWRLRRELAPRQLTIEQRHLRYKVAILKEPANANL